MRNKIFNLLVVIVLACIFLYLFIFTNGLTQLTVQFRSLSLIWLIIAGLCIILFWSFESFILYIITKSLYCTDHLFIKSVKAAMIGQFFSAITPFQSGGQPSQLYVMTENDIPAGFSGSILMVKFIIHQATLTFYSIIVIVLEFNFFNAKIPFFIYFCFLGFTLNTIIIVFALIFSVNDKLTGKILTFILKIHKKIKFLKEVENRYQHFEEELKSFHESAAFISKNAKLCIISSILTFLQWTVYYSIPFCIYKSFGLSSASLWTMISAQVFLTMFMSFIPLPGAAVGAEGGFYLIFGIFFKGESIVPAIFMWRIITYYSSIAAGGLASVLLPNITSEKSKISNKYPL